MLISGNPVSPYHTWWQALADWPTFAAVLEQRKAELREADEREREWRETEVLAAGSPLVACDALPMLPFSLLSYRVMPCHAQSAMPYHAVP